MSDLYKKLHTQSLTSPDTFWGEAAQEISWMKTWDQVVDTSNLPFTRWFPGAILNTCYNAIDRHVENGRATQAAIIYDSPVTETIETITYQELQKSTALFAGVLSQYGVKQGDRVVIYMPMIPQSLIAMFACTRIGAIHSVVFGGFASQELATRIDDAQPKIIVTASCGIEGKKIIAYKPILDQALALCQHQPKKSIIYQRSFAPAILRPGFDVDWNEAMAQSTGVDCVPLAATDPLYILYTSGTTGQPKGIVRDNGGHAVALHWTMRYIYNVKPGEVFWSASDIGWIVGHSYIVYAPLLYGATTVLFEGKPVGTPDAGTFWRIINQHKVRKLFTAPTALRAIKREDPQGQCIKDYDLSHFEILFLAGERSDPNTIQWAETNLKIPVIDHWWQTETAWTICGNPMGIHHFPVKYGSATMPMPGWDIRVHNEQNQEVTAKEIGALVAKLPLPPGTFPTLWKSPERYIEKYMAEYPGFYQTGDAGYMDEEGYVYVMSRTDDIINVAGHRLSTGAMEEVLSSHPDVAECAVVGVADQLKGQLPVGFLVLKTGTQQDDQTIIQEVIQMVRQSIGPVAAFKLAVVVPQLPKTRSGKILRATIQKIADSNPYKMPPTIDDPQSLMSIEKALKNLGYAENPKLVE